jgi:hypothetical protein
MDRDSSVGIVTHYRMGGLGIEFQWGRNFPNPALGPTQYSIQQCKSFPGIRWPGRRADHPPTSRAEVKEKVELYLYSTSEPSLPVLGRTLPVPINFQETTG